MSFIFKLKMNTCSLSGWLWINTVEGLKYPNGEGDRYKWTELAKNEYLNIINIT